METSCVICVWLLTISGVLAFLPVLAHIILGQHVHFMLHVLEYIVSYICCFVFVAFLGIGIEMLCRRE